MSSLAITAEYHSDGDKLMVTAYVKVGDNYTTKVVETGTCSCVWQNAVVESVTFDKTYGNSDGSFKLCFNHPVIRTPQVRVHVVLKDGTVLDNVVQAYVIGKTDTVLSKNI